MMKGLEHLLYEERLRELRLRRILSVCTNSQGEGQEAVDTKENVKFPLVQENRWFFLFFFKW